MKILRNIWAYLLYKIRYKEFEDTDAAKKYERETTMKVKDVLREYERKQVL